MKLYWCRPGSFHMGNSAGKKAELGNANPVGVVLTQGFWIGKFEVTQEQWRRVMGVTLRQQRARDPSQPRPLGDGSTRDHVGEGPDYPIYFVSYHDAQEFCRKLTEQERKAGRLTRSLGLWSADRSPVGIRLPGRYDDRFQLRRQAGRPRCELRWNQSFWRCPTGPIPQGDDACRTLPRERLGRARHARQRLGVVPGWLRG